MRIFSYLLASASLLACFSADAALKNVFGVVSKEITHGQKSMSHRKPASMLRSQQQRADYYVLTYRAKSQKVYAWDGENWELDGSYSFEYDKTGRTLQEILVDYEGIYYRTSYTYDSNDMVTNILVETSEDGVAYENVSKTEREYDGIVTGLITKNREFLWEDGGWLMLGNNYDRNITRNALGNVTNVEIAVLYDGKFDPTQRLLIEYGDDAKATSIKESILNYDGKDFYWEDGLTISNIVWEDTDGQIVSIEGFGLGANRIKSCDQTDGYDVVHTDLTYDGDNFTAIMTGTMDGDTMQGKSAYESLDEYGSYRETDTYTYISDWFGTMTEEETYTYRVDAYGNMLESKGVYVSDDYEEIYEDLQGTVEYDWAFGMPITYILTTSFLDYDTEEYVTENMFKIEFSDYIGIPTEVGVDSIEVSGSDAEVIYLNLQGSRVANPAPGNIYIRKDANGTSKVIF